MGVRTTAKVVSAHPLGSRHAWLVGTCFERSGGQFRVEMVAPSAHPPHEFGIWAYDMGKWTSATHELRKRCEFFDKSVLRTLLKAADARAQSSASVPREPPAVRHASVVQLHRSEMRSSELFRETRARIEVAVEPRAERVGWVRVATSGGSALDAPFCMDEDEERAKALEAIDAVYISGGYPMPIERLCDGTAGVSFAGAAQSRGATPFSSIGLSSSFRAFDVNVPLCTTTAARRPLSGWWRMVTSDGLKSDWGRFSKIRARQSVTN